MRRSITSAPWCSALRRWRADAGITQQALAAYLGVTRVAVTQWELGLRRPDGETLREIELMSAGLVGRQLLQEKRGVAHEA